MSDNVAIKVEIVSKTFRLPHEKNTSIKSAVVNFYRRNKSYEKQQVLQDISFEVKKGEFFGIVGRNGSGKSTLLKLLANIYFPDTGSINVSGKLTPFIELGVGFNPELTGRENVFLNGALLGFNRKEMLAMYDEIVEFAELERFMDQKLKNYSSGMQVRLAFSIAIRAKSDILLIDEVLAVGDSAFQKKCYEVFIDLKKQGRTIVFVTHDMSAVERFCDKVLVIHKGNQEGVMTPGEASAFYDELNAETSVKGVMGAQSNRWGSGRVKLEDVQFTSNGKVLNNNLATTGEPLEIRLNLSSKKPEDIVVGLAFEDTFGINVAGPNSIGESLTSKRAVTYRIKQLGLVPGEYKVTVAIFDKDANKEYDHHDRAFLLKVKSTNHNIHGKIELFGAWS